MGRLNGTKEVMGESNWTKRTIRGSNWTKRIMRWLNGTKRLNGTKETLSNGTKEQWDDRIERKEQ